MIERLNPFSAWRSLRKKEKKTFLVGMLLGIILMIPVLAIDDNIAKPTSYITTIVEDKISYNYLYNMYCSEIGNATDFDRAIIIQPLIDNSTYRNMAITIYSDYVSLRYICFIDNNDNVIKKIKTPNIAETYTLEVSDIKNVVVFLFSTVQVYSIEMWVW